MAFNLQGFQAQLKALQGQSGPRLVLFTSSWCPDCIRAAPAVRRAATACGALLLEVDVGPGAEWRNPGHPLRVDPQLKLTGIPTLFSWGASGPELRLGRELEKAPTPQAAEALTMEFLERIGK